MTLEQDWNAERTARQLAEDRLRQVRWALEALHDRIKDYDNGRQEGSYFAGEIQEIINEYW